MLAPAKFNTKVTTNWYMLCPKIIFHMDIVMRGEDLGSGRRSRMERGGGSVAKARAAKVSMIRLTHSSCTAVKTEDSVEDATAETNVRMTAVMLTVI